MTSGQEFYQFLNYEQISNSLLHQLNDQEQAKIELNMCKDCESIALPLNKSKNKKQKAINRARKQKTIEEGSSNPNIKLGHWGVEENKKYHWFLELYNSHFMNKHMRRMDKIFKTMANFVGSREAQQCRSHHQKMEKKYHSFSKILINLRKQHYNTKETAQIEADMIANNVEIVGQLLTANELEQQIYTLPNTPSEHTLKSQNQTEQMNLVLFQEENDPIADLFCDENYENNLNFIGFF